MRNRCVTRTLNTAPADPEIIATRTTHAKSKRTAVTVSRTTNAESKETDARTTNKPGRPLR